MNRLKLLLALSVLSIVGGCAVYPAPYYGPPRAYYQPGPVYYGPAFGIYGGWHEGWHDRH